MELIKTVFGQLSQSQQQTLLYAREHRIAQHIEYIPGKFIGILAEHIEYLTIQYTDGDWSLGTVNHVLCHRGSS